MNRAVVVLAACLAACATAEGAQREPPAAQLGPLRPAAQPARPSAAAFAAARAPLARARTLASEIAPPPCPAEMALIGKSCVDRWEAHLVTLGPSGDVVRHPHHQRPPADTWYQARSAPGVSPQAYISRVEAKRACERADKRLCTWTEWRRACQGAGWQRYPYGNGAQRGACNVGRQHLLYEKFGAGPWEYEAHFNDPSLNQEPGYLAATGAFERCVSSEGVHDLVGNLHEWVSTTVTESFVARMEEEDVERREQPWVEGNGIFMGGFYSTVDQLGPGCFYTTIAHEPSYHDYSTGFRCCADATPGAERVARR